MTAWSTGSTWISSRASPLHEPTLCTTRALLYR
jgi:hypothetical protein